MSQIAQTTKIHGKHAPVEMDLDTEALALARRVSERLKVPTPTTPQMVLENEYEPQDIVVKPNQD
jgi:hypothetical protein